jgi:hypothetical protein
MTRDPPPTGSQPPITSSLDISPPRPRDRTPPPINPSSLPQHQQRVYTCLRTQGWSPQQCNYYFAKIPSRQRHVHLVLRHVEGWNEEQLSCFDQRCAEEYLPEGLPPPDPEDDNIPVSNFWLNHRLLEDGNLRRRRIAKRMVEEMDEVERAGVQERQMEERRRREMQEREVPSS